MIDNISTVHFDPYDPAFCENPYPVYARLRAEAPVVYNRERNFYALSRYDDVLMAHRDAVRFSSAGGVTIEGHEASSPLLIVKDQPEHSWSKGLVTKLFSRPRMNALDIFIRERTVSLLDELYERHGPHDEFDFVSAFSVQLPLDVISELLGIPAALRPEIHSLANVSVARGEGVDMEKVAAAGMRSVELYLGLAMERRANPSDDIVSTLIAEEVIDDQGVAHRLSDLEIAVRFTEMGFAGHETVAKTIPNGVMAFQKFPDQRRKLIEDRSLLANAVEEILRYDPPSQLQGRTTTCDVELHGHTIPQGSKTMLLTGSAMRDPTAFDEPDRFDIERKLDTRSVYFGFGVHKCLGIHLARQELAIAFGEILERYPDFEVDIDRSTRAVLSNVRGVSSLPITLGKRK